METKESFEALLRAGGHLSSLDLKSGYRNFGLEKYMRSLLLFRYGGRFYSFKEFPFGLGRRLLWFFNLLKTLGRDMGE